MTRPGLAQPPGGATLHRSSPARLTLAVGLLALGIGDLAVIHRVLLPRYFAEAGATRVAVASVAVVGPVAGPPAVPVAVTPPPPPPVKPAVPATEPAPAPSVVSPPVVVGEHPPAAPAPAGEFPDLLFAINTNWLSRASRETLDQVVAALEADAGRRVILSGHTDAAGPPEVNRALARDRARRASRYLQAHGLDPSRVEIRSFGSERPAPDAPPGAMRARNRRVEIAIE